MAIFPAIPPIHPAPKRTSMSSGAFLFGDGYERATRFGINTVRPEWQLVWEVSAADADTVEAFLQAQCDAGDSFDWQPPDAVIALRWRCDEWNVEQVAYNWFRVSASFKRVFELSGAPVITPTAATCDDDVLCEADTGSTPITPIFVTSRSIGFAGALNYTHPNWSAFMNLYAITFRTSNANGVTDTSSAFFTATNAGTYKVLACADNINLVPFTSLTVNGQTCTVASFDQALVQTNVTILTPGEILVQIVITNELGNPNFNLNPMGMSFTIEGPI